MTRKTTSINSSECDEQEARPSIRRMALRDTVGGAILELALLVPAFSTMVLGAAEFARLAYASIEVTNAARAGVAYGSQSSATASDLTGMQTAATNDGGDVASLSAVATEFWSCSTAPATQFTSPPTCTGARVLNYVQVRTTATVNPIIHLLGLPTTFTLHGLAIMRVL
jgi:Flp pilus assembly protein TadG